MLLTEVADGLPSYLRPGEEVETFTDVDDLAAKIRRYQSQPLQRDAIARAGYARVCRDHVYEARFEPILGRVSELSAARQCHDWRIMRADLEPWVAHHRNSAVLRRTAADMVLLSGRLLRTNRVSRALRRIAFEASWRLCGEGTYRASGWPGRLFYRDS
jgi:spore maturation protein CgeB